MKSALDHLRAAVADLTASRDELHRQIQVLNRTIDELRSAQPNPTTVALPLLPPDEEPTRTVRDIVIELGTAEQTFSLDKVVSAAHAEGNNAKAASISSILSRMKQQGELESVRRGVYRLQKPETPDHSGVSVTQTESSVGADGPLEEGGVNDDRGHPGDHPTIRDY